MLAFGCLLNAVSLYMMTSLTLGMDYWALALPRFIQGFAVGFIFVPLSTLMLATIQRDKLVNATSRLQRARNRPRPGGGAQSVPPAADREPA